MLYAPFDVRLGDMTAIQPDIVVARRTDIHDDGYTRRPVRCVEIASPSTRDLDLGGKKDTLAEIGCQVYWTIEPDDGADGGPELTVWGLRGQGYVETARVSGRAPYVTHEPFDLTLVPADLLNG